VGGWLDAKFLELKGRVRTALSDKNASQRKGKIKL
jgi:hypothetical protein